MLDGRDKPIIIMLEWIRCYLSKRMVIRREWIKKFKEKLLPNCYSKLEALKDQVTPCQAEWFSDLQFHVRCGDGEQYTVFLDLQSCAQL